MKRRTFLQTTGKAVLAGSLLGGTPLAAIARNRDRYPELAKHKIEQWELKEVNFHWPRFVGKNGRIDFHGQHKKCTVLQLITDQGAMGWGLANNDARELCPPMIGTSVAELIIPGEGVVDGLNRSVDFALHDLMGVIMDQPVHRILGNRGTTRTPVYSGMIYLDELNPENTAKGLDAVLESCEWDYNYGYRQLKVKIGRSGRWYPHREGLKKDIEVVRLIRETFKDRNLDILVDANDMYSYKDTIQFLKGIKEVPLFWIEEPFRESVKEGTKLRRWMDRHGFEKTLYVDGEANPDHELCLQLGREKIMDAFLPDIFGYGFTKWIQLSSTLHDMEMLASPHAWGNLLKTHYIAHYAAAYGGVPTIEGVTCLSDEIDFGDYPIRDGELQVSDAPGFGMKLLV